MTGTHTRFYEMLMRVQLFWNAHRHLIENGSRADVLFQRVDAARRMLSERARTKATDAGTRRTSVGMCASGFFMPGRHNDRRVVDVARIFLQQAAPLKAAFIENHMPEDFLAALEESTRRLEAFVEEQALRKSQNLRMTTEVRETVADASDALHSLDPVMDNVLRNNAPMRAAWSDLRRVDRRRAKTVPVADVAATTAA
jgi:hypothetical protein